MIRCFFFFLLLIHLLCSSVYSQHDDTAAAPCLSSWTEWGPWQGSCEDDGIIARYKYCKCIDTTTDKDSNDGGSSNINSDTNTDTSTASDSGQIIDPKYCDETPANFVQTKICGELAESHTASDSAEPLGCHWEWSTWSLCSTNCGGGLTSRSQNCYCNGEESDKCNTLIEETVSCNEHPCGAVKAHNSFYWLNQHEAYFREKFQSNGASVSAALAASAASAASVLRWPFPNPKFNCSLSENSLHLKSTRHLTDVLHEIINDSTYNPIWTLLAKQYVATLLNLFNGYQPTPEGIPVIHVASNLIENCAGYAPEEMLLVNTTREQLQRLNDNIGGLSSLYQHNFPTPSSFLSPFYRLVLIIGGSLVLVVFLTIAIYIYVNRQREYNGPTEWWDSDTSTQEDALAPSTPIPLNLPRVAVRSKSHENEDTDSTGEESM